MKSLFLLSVLLVSLATRAQDNPWRVVGTGVIGFIQTDSVWVGKKPNEKMLKQATNAAELWPEMAGNAVFGAIVWPCYADSAGWYKVHKIAYDSDGEDVGINAHVAYVKHSAFIEFQSWDEYLKGKYLYDIPSTTKFFATPNDKSPISCHQRSCLQIAQVQGDWAKVITPNAGCDADLKICITEAWVKWHDGKGKLLVSLRP